MMIVSMCLSCQHAYLQNHVINLCQIFVHVARDRGSVLFWWHCNTLCTSGFVDDDTSSSSSRKDATSVAEMLSCTARFRIMGRVTHFNIGVESDVYDCLVSQCTGQTDGQTHRPTDGCREWSIRPIESDTAYLIMLLW